MKKKEAIQALVNNRETILNYKMEVIDEFTSIGLVTRHDEGRQYRLMLDLIDQIYNDHEAQLKLASDVYSTDKMHMYQELKAKDKITQDIKEAYELKSIAYDLLLEAIKLKDEEIERLKALQQHKSCEGCKYGKYGADSRGIEVECTLIWHCARGNGFPDRYEAKEQ